MLNLKPLVEKEISATAKVIEVFPWEEPRAYGMWLAQTHHFISHSTRLLALAAAQCDLEDSRLHSRYLEHLREETGHEKLSQSDLSNLGFSTGDLPILAQSVAMYQSQFYLIERKGPAAFFGYILALEGLGETCGPAVYQRVLKAHGPNCSKFLKVHSHEDVEHMQKAYEQINSFGEAMGECIADNLKYSLTLYRSILEDSQKWTATNSHHPKAA